MRNDKSPAESVERSKTSEKKDRSYKNGKHPSLFLHIVIIVTITLAAIAVAIFLGQKNYHKTIRLATDQFNQQQLILARSAAAGIETFIADINSDMFALSNLPVVQRMEPGILDQMKILYEAFPPQTSSRRLDKNGILRFIYPKEGWRKGLTGQDYSREAWFQKAKETGKIVISGSINEVGERRIRVAKPVYIENEKGAKKFNGVIICSFDPKTLSKLYISPIISGDIGYAWMLNEDGIFLTHHEEEFVDRNAFKVRKETNPKLSYNEINNIQRQMMAGEEGTGLYTSGWHRGQKGKIEKLIAYTPVHVFDKVWSVAVCAPTNEVERITSKTYRSYLYTLGFIIFILTASGGFFFIAFYRWVQSLQQEVKARKQAEEKIKEYSENLEGMVKERTRELNQAFLDTEEALDKIDGILKSIANGLIVTDMYHNIVLMNRAAEDLLGVRLSEVIDRPIDLAIQDETLREKVRYTINKKTTGYQFDFESPGDAPKHPRIMRARTSVIYDKKGKKIGIVTIIYDVTYEREVDRMKTEFISTAAHELRTPLTSIQGFSEILLTRDNITDEEGKKFLSYINTQAVNLAEIVNDLLDISRIESEQVSTLNKVQCDADELIKKVIPCFQDISPKHRLEVVLPDKHVELFVDKEKMWQVLINILGNAVKYSPEGSVIRVVGEVVTNAEYPIADFGFRNAELKHKDVYLVSVQDEGIGMSPEQIKKIFDKFYRADASDSAPEGTGLGMTIVKYIVEAHGGKVWVESELGKGTTVRFAIPT